MRKVVTGPFYGICALALAASLAACGGGGGGGGTTPPTNGGGGGNGGGNPTPVATPTESATGSLSIAGTTLANAQVTFTCGCSQGAGLITTNSSGAYTITQTAPLAPKGNGTYTLQGHNVLVVGYSPTSATQAWTMAFVGNSPSTDLNLGATDNAATATALFLFYEVNYNATIANSNDQTFDWFNFNTVNSWTTHLRTAPDTAEAKLLSDVTSMQSAGTSLFPYLPSWNPTSDGVNETITNDLAAVAQGGITADAALPTPCPSAGGCTGAPTP